jgi:hypothetical protein
MSLVAGLLNQNLDYLKSVTTDGYGDISTTTLYSDIPCRWQEMIEQEVLATGEVITYTVKMFLYPNIDIRKGYQAVYDLKTYTVQKVNPKYDLIGQKDHLEVYLS